jgi:RNA polymerase sigma-70 factor (ECF subfamily)
MAALYRRFAPMVHAIVIARLPRQEAADLVQQAFVDAMQRLGALREAGRFGAWLAAIARSRAADFHRRRRPTVALDEERAALPHDREGLGTAEVLAALGRLPEAYRETLLMRLSEGMTGPEIAARTGLTPGSVRVNLHRGMKLLRAELGLGEERVEPD